MFDATLMKNLFAFDDLEHPADAAVLGQIGNLTNLTLGSAINDRDSAMSNSVNKELGIDRRSMVPGIKLQRGDLGLLVTFVLLSMEMKLESYWQGFVRRPRISFDVVVRFNQGSKVSVTLVLYSALLLLMPGHNQDVPGKWLRLGHVS
jgi:hypothetical protein